MAILLSLMLALFGCTGGTSEASKTDARRPSTATNGDGQFKVALLTPGPISDAGWSAMAYEGLQAIEKELGATVSNQEAKGPQIKDAMRSYAQEGYDIVFGHGYEYNEPGVQLAKDFPETVFISSSGGGTAANAGAFRFYLEQGFYLAGAMAAQLSKSGKLGMVAGDDVPSIRSTFKAFEAGAKAVKPDITILPAVFTGSGSDIALAKRATEQLIAQGADYIIHQANAAAQGVFDACKEKGATAFGANLDQNANPSGVVLASAVIIAGPAFVELAKQVKNGSFKGSIVLMGMDKGAIDFIVNPSMAEKIPSEVMKSIDELKLKIKNGELTVPKDEF